MDTQEFLENIGIWIESYNANRDSEKDYVKAETKADIRWEIGMLKVASLISPVDSIMGTPAQKKVEHAVQTAKLKDPSRLKEIYDILNDIKVYLSGVE